MIKKLIFLNLALLALVAFLGHRLNADLKKFWTRSNITTIKKEATDNAKKASSKKAAPANAVVAARPAPPPTEYQVIADKNLFSETRSMAVAEGPLPKPQPPELNPKPYLYGVIEDSRSVRTALLEDNGPAVGPPVGGVVTHPIPGRPGPPPSTRKTMVPLKLGEYYRGYKVTEITSERVTLTYGENEKIEYIPLFDKTKPKGMGGHAMMPPPPMPANYNQGQVVSLSNGPKAGASGQGNTGVGIPPPAPIPTPGTNPAVTSLSPGSTSTTKTGTTIQPVTSSTPYTAPTTQRKSTSGREVIKDGKRYIRTPFGDVPRDN